MVNTLATVAPQTAWLDEKNRSACGSARCVAQAVRLATSMETLHWKCIVTKKVPDRTTAAWLEKQINGNAPLWPIKQRTVWNPWLRSMDMSGLADELVTCNQQTVHSPQPLPQNQGAPHRLSVGRTPLFHKLHLTNLFPMK